MKNHPASEIFPMMGSESFARLKADIGANGLIEPIWVYENQILDGRNRERACRELSFEPDYRDYTGDSPTEFVMSLNFERRHLTSSQRAMIAIKALPVLEEEAKERQLATLKHSSIVSTNLCQREPGRAAEKAGKLAGVSRNQVHAAKRIARLAPEEIAKIESGEKTINKVLKEITEEPETEQPGKGLDYAYKAIGQLRLIPKRDNLRQEGFNEVISWIKHNRGEQDV